MSGSFDIDPASSFVAEIASDCELLARHEPKDIFELQDRVQKCLSIRKRWANNDQLILSYKEEMMVEKNIIFACLRLKDMKEKRLSEYEVDADSRSRLEIVDTMLHLAGMDRAFLPINFKTRALYAFVECKPAKEENENEQELLQLKLLIQSTKHSFDQLNISQDKYENEIFSEVLNLVGSETRAFIFEHKNHGADLLQALLKGIDDRVMFLSGLYRSTERTDDGDKVTYCWSPNSKNRCELCILKNRSSKKSDCTENSTDKENVKRASELNKCPKCLEKGHLVEICNQPGCDICNKSHSKAMYKKLFHHDRSASAIFFASQRYAAPSQDFGLDQEIEFEQSFKSTPSMPKPSTSKQS